MGGLFTRLKGWVAKPFDAEGDWFNWFLFLGLIIVSVFLWTRILKLIREIAE